MYQNLKTKVENGMWKGQMGYYRMKQRFLDMLQDESGVGTVELVLILVVLILIVLVFKDRIGALMAKIMNQIDKSAASVWETGSGT